MNNADLSYIGDANTQAMLNRHVRAPVHVIASAVLKEALHTPSVAIVSVTLDDMGVHRCNTGQRRGFEAPRSGRYLKAWEPFYARRR